MDHSRNSHENNNEASSNQTYWQQSGPVYASAHYHHQHHPPMMQIQAQHYAEPSVQRLVPIVPNIQQPPANTVSTSSPGWPTTSQSPAQFLSPKPPTRSHRARSVSSSAQRRASSGAPAHPRRSSHGNSGNNPGPRKTLTDEDRRAMCQYHTDNPGKKQTEIAKIFKVERSTVSKVLRQSDRYMLRDDASAPDPSKAKGKHHDFERGLMVWAKNFLENEGTPVSNEEIMFQVEQWSRWASDKEIAKFKDPAWLETFKAKYGVKVRNEVKAKTSPGRTEPAQPPPQPAVAHRIVERRRPAPVANGSLAEGHGNSKTRVLQRRPSSPMGPPVVQNTATTTPGGLSQTTSAIPTSMPTLYEYQAIPLPSALPSSEVFRLRSQSYPYMSMQNGTLGTTTLSYASGPSYTTVIPMGYQPWGSMPAAPNAGYGQPAMLINNHHQPAQSMIDSYPSVQEQDHTTPTLSATQTSPATTSSGDGMPDNPYDHTYNIPTVDQAEAALDVLQRYCHNQPTHLNNNELRTIHSVDRTRLKPKTRFVDTPMTLSTVSHLAHPFEGGYVADRELVDGKPLPVTMGC